MKITILTDKTSWMNKYDVELKNKLLKLGHSVKIIHSKNALSRGDIAFFLSCFELIKEDKLKLNKHNIVVHPSDLPKGKGWSPTSWQILEGKNKIPLSLFEAVESVDAGDIYLKDSIVLNGSELADEWRVKIANKIIDMCLCFTKKNQNNTIKGIKQKGKSTFYKKRTPIDCELNVNKSIAQQFNLFRIIDNELYPAFFRFKGKIFKLKIEEFKGCKYFE
ncbi:MAG: methionyl-tRNA formyltransferase [Elusimicrobiota bacterium]|jgi:methionyl-tRNA formyltransferase|nr:methionyl-tRNA formyltransferase [Elusimicrobiota bacterium]